MATSRLRSLSRFDKSNSVFVGGMSWITGTQQLKQYLETFGRVTNIYMFMDNYRGVNQGSAVVKFADEQTVDKVFQQKEHTLDNKSITIRAHNPGGRASAKESKSDEPNVDNQWHL